jgi:hypothetical protein
MSYDLDLFQPEPGIEPLLTAERLFLADEGDEDEESEASDLGNIVAKINPGPPQPELERRKQELAQSLIQHNPALTVFPIRSQEIASMFKHSEEEARVRFRHLELNGPENGNGIQITLFDNTISITIPYWHRGEAARGAFQEIWGYLGLLERVANYRAYDPQLGRVLNLEKDFPEVLLAYEGVVQQTQDL